MGALDGKVAIVTGAGRGIGRGEALALAAEGAAVVVNDLGLTADGTSGHGSGGSGAPAGDVAAHAGSGGSGAPADEVAAPAGSGGSGGSGTPADDVVAEIEATGGRAVADGSDVASWSGAEQLVATAVERFGRLDILVNNAGFLRDRMSFKMDEEAWDDVVRVHLKGHFAPSRFAAAHWRERHKAGDETGGVIVNTVSEAGLYGGTGQANYVAAKAGIAGMTIGLARELGRYGVRVNAVAPRARTRMTEALLGDFAAARDGEFDEWHPDNVGPVVAWLASDGAADISGQVFVVVGGRVHRFRGWEMVGEVEQPERWSVAALDARRDELFAGDPTGPPTMGFGR